MQIQWNAIKFVQCNKVKSTKIPVVQISAYCTIEAKSLNTH